MKKKICYLFFACVSLGWTQGQSTHHLKPFQRLKVFKGLQVNLIPSQEEKIVIVGEKASEVYLKNKKGTLSITLNLKSVFESKALQIDLFYAGKLLELEAFQGASIRSEHTFSQSQIRLSAQEDASIELPVALDYLKMQALTGSTVRLSGSCNSQNCKITTGANYQALDLQTKTTAITVTSGAEANIDVSVVLDAKVSLGGLINYRGNPQSLLTKKVLGGKIKNIP